MSQTWTIRAESRVYGPYNAEQMQVFRDQGRLAPHSLVARSGQDNYRPASEDQGLASLFVALAVSDLPTVKTEQPAKFGRDAEAIDGEVNRYVIIADMKSGSIAGIDEEINKMGPACRLTMQTWILNSEISLSTLRSALTQKLGKLDNLFIVDVSHDKAAWFNFGPEVETRLRSLWLRHDQRKAS